MVENGSADLPSTPPARRVVVLGASNVTLGLSTLIGAAQSAWGAPLDLLVAAGFGRSYGVRSHVLGRGLPGILQCRLWEDLANRPPAPTAALVTDIGNDILYGSDASRILCWLDTCLQRLRPLVERLVVTRLPLASIDRCPDWQLRLLTSLLFPSSRVATSVLRARAHELDAHLVTYAGQYHAYVVRPDRRWYRWDPIHVTRAHRACAWQTYLYAWSADERSAMTRPAAVGGRKLRFARPHEWTRFGMARHRAQPAVRFANGTMLSLY